MQWRHYFFSLWPCTVNKKSFPRKLDKRYTTSYNCCYLKILPNLSTLGLIFWQKWPYSFFKRNKKVFIFWGTFMHPSYKNKFERVMWQPCDWLDNWGLVIGWMTKGAITSKKKFWLWPFKPSAFQHLFPYFLPVFFLCKSNWTYYLG